MRICMDYIHTKQQRPRATTYFGGAMMVAKTRIDLIILDMERQFVSRYPAKIDSKISGSRQPFRLYRRANGYASAKLLEIHHTHRFPPNVPGFPCTATPNRTTRSTFEPHSISGSLCTTKSGANVCITSTDPNDVADSKIKRLLCGKQLLASEKSGQGISAGIPYYPTRGIDSQHVGRTGGVE